MKLVIVAILDRAAQTFANPWYVTHIGQATRTFSDEVNRQAPDNTLNQHPSDFELYRLGDYENSTAKITTDEEPRMIARGEDLIRK